MNFNQYTPQTLKSRAEMSSNFKDSSYQNAQMLLSPQQQTFGRVDYPSGNQRNNWESGTFVQNVKSSFDLGQFSQDYTNKYPNMNQRRFDMKGR
jgi:CobQ-like glutamine amidotransferase family enzyme